MLAPSLKSVLYALAILLVLSACSRPENFSQPPQTFWQEEKESEAC
jgi:putative hemolysin